MSPYRLSENGALIAYSRTCRLTPSTPARISVNSASGAHSAVANVLLTPGLPPHVTELSSVRRNFKPAACATATAAATSFFRPDEAAGLSRRETVA